MRMKTVDGQVQYLILDYIERQKLTANRHLFKNCFQMVNQKLSSQ